MGADPKFYVSVIHKRGLADYEYIDEHAQVDKYLEEVYNRYQERQVDEQEG